MLENPIVAGAILGGIGGTIRGIIGFWNAHMRGEKFHACYFFVSVGVALLIGVGIAMALEGSGYVRMMAMLGGYGGTDFLERLGHATKVISHNR